MQGKLIRFDYKVWCPNSENSYVVNLFIYQSKNSNLNDHYEAALGKDALPLISILDSFTEKISISSILR